MSSRFSFALVALTLSAGTAMAQLSYTTPGSAYGNTFDNLASTPATGNAWTNDSTYSGWFLFNSQSAAIVTYNAANGGSNAGSFYSFGATGSGERALGGVGAGTSPYFGTPGPASGAIAGWIAFAVTNNTGATLTDAGISFDGEQWRNGGATSPAVSVAQTMVLEYGFGATFAAVANWTAPGANFDWSSPVFGTTAAAAVDGNVAGLVAGRGGTLSNLNWSNGDTLWVRWVERNDAGNDHGLAIDNFGFSARTASPTPGAAALLGMGGLILGRRRR